MFQYGIPKRRSMSIFPTCMLLAYTHTYWISSWYWATLVFYWHPPEDFGSHDVRLLAANKFRTFPLDIAVLQWCHWKEPASNPCTGTSDKTGMSWEAVWIGKDVSQMLCTCISVYWWESGEDRQVLYRLPIALCCALQSRTRQLISIYTDCTNSV